MQANRKAAAAFVAAVHAAATSKPAEDNGPFGSMAAALGRVRLLDDMSHEIFLLPDRQQVLDVVFEAKPVRAVCPLYGQRATNRLLQHFHMIHGSLQLIKYRLIIFLAMEPDCIQR